MRTDEQLDTLYDYTKFHIGIYLSFATGIGALLAAEKVGWIVSSLLQNYGIPIGIALVLMLFAGMCGGIVASCTIESLSFAQFWNSRQVPRLLSCLERWAPHGRLWAAMEHTFFWISIVMLAGTVLFATLVPAPSSPKPAQAACELTTAPITVKLRSAD